MAQQDLKLLENQLLIGKNEAIGKLIKGTDQYYYYSFLKLFNEQKLQLNEEQQKQLTEYREFKTSLSANINLRALFLEYDKLNVDNSSLEIEKQQREILKKINKQLFNYQFEHSSKLIGTSNTSGLIQDVIYESIFDNKVLQIDGYLENAYTEEGFAQLNENLYSYLDLQKLSTSPLKIIKQFLDNVGNEIIDMKSVPFLFNHLSNLKEFKNNFNQNQFRKLSLKQLEEIVALNQKFLENQHFVGELYLKKFQYNLKDVQYSKLTEQEKKETQQHLKQIYQWTITLPPKFKSFSDQILYELLQVGIEVNEYDFDLFITYLKDPKEIYSFVSEQYKPELKIKSRTYQSEWHKYHQLNTNRWSDTNQLIQTYLYRYLEKNNEISLFEQFLDTKYLKTIQAEVKLYQGQELPNIYDYINSQQVEQMNNSKLITICQFNKLFFTNGEKVKLFVELKNISQLNVKIFEFNCENYYLQKQQQLDSNVNLDGLIAFEETNFTYNYPPIQKIIKEFEFETITNALQGIFIIEFIGNGISSRAIIKKGRLQLRETITVAGHRFQIFDENFNICVGERTGFWLDKTFYKVNQERKEILVPFGQIDKSFNAILIHDKFAEFTQLTIQKEKYEFKCAFLVTDEQLIMGSQAKTIIIPKLYLNETEINLNLITDQKVIVINTNDAGVPSTIPFDNIKFDQIKPIEIQFPITSKIKLIQIKVTGKIKTMHKDNENNNEIEVEQTHQLIFNNFEGTTIFCDQFLKFEEQSGYELYFVGKNGEPKKGLQVNINFYQKYVKEILNKSFSTDINGSIKLGYLDNVSSLTSTVSQLGDIQIQEKTWQIESSSQIQYPKQINILSGEKIDIPYKGTASIQNNIVLYKTLTFDSGTTIESLSDIIQFNDNKISFTLQKSGTYELLLIKDSIIINVNVLDGEKWKNTDIIKQKDKLIIDKTLSSQLSINNIAKIITDNGTKITGQIYSQKQAQIFVFATQFLNQNFSQQITQIEQLLNKDRLESIQINLYSSIYQSNKELSDEQKYVLNRKTQERYIGNTLEKPQILLKRQEVRETETQGEQLNQEGQYQHQQQLRACEKLCEKDQLSLCGINQYYKTQEINTFQDFLLYPAQLLSDIQIKNGQFEFIIPKQYSTAIILAFNDSNYQYQYLPLINPKIQTRNLAHQSTLKKDKFYSIFRTSTNVEKSKPIQVQDLTSTEIKLVDSLDKLYVILKELNQASNNQIFEFTKWDFLPKWCSQVTEQKHKLYDEYQCDELNLFIYFKDPAFYETYTEAYIRNKIEKSFIDHFLLKNSNELQKYGSYEQLNTLNALEQVLLVIYFAEIENNIEEAKLIAQYLDNINKQQVIDQKIFKKYFDTVLGAKIEAEEEQFGGGGGGEFQQQQYCQQQFINNNIIPQSRLMQVQQFVPEINNCCLELAREYSCSQKMEIECEECECDSSDNSCDEIERKCLSKPYYNEKRSQFIENFKNIERTKEYQEKHYSSGTNKSDFQNLVSLNSFYVELANHSIQKGILKEDFLSSKFIYCNNTLTELISVLALIGLPNESPIQEYKSFGGKGVEITTQSSGIFFMKEIREGKAQLRQDILVSQRFFDPQDRFGVSEDDPELYLEKDIKECLINKIYGCQVIVTNCSSTRADYQVLVEVPNGAIPVNTIFYSKSYTIQCQPYTTERIEYYFYFPQIGTFSIYPANVSRFGQVVCVAQESSLQVVEQKTVHNLDALDDILVKGSKEDILNFLQNKNIFNRTIFKPEDIRYLLKDKDFYLKVIDIFRKRRYFDFESLKYSFYHNDQRSLKELFKFTQIQIILKNKFKYFKCSLFEISDVKMLEYYPLITKRVHKLTSEAKGILNIEFREQYINYLIYLVEKPTHNLSDKLGFIYYLLLQERINEAIQIYKTIGKVEEQNDAQLQYDYFTAYLDFYIGYPNFAKAREICEKYLNYPVIHWRNLYYEVVNLLAEYDGDDDENQKLKTDQTLKQKQQEYAKKEEILETIIEGNTIQVTYSNLDQVTVQFFKIDLEVLHSRNPFLKQSDEDFSFVLPNGKLDVKLEEKQQNGLTYKTNISIPEELRKFNLFIQTKGVNKISSNRYYSTSLNVQTIENYGQIKVSDNDGKYLSKVYIKVYIMEKNGNQSFYKDGYTDLRGRFDYASLSSSNLSNAQKFSLFISSDDHGSIIKEVNAPAQVGKYETEVKLVSKSWNEKAIKEQQRQTNQYECSKVSYKR